MTKDIMLSMLRKGSNGEEILQILDSITPDAMMQEEETPEPIDLWTMETAFVFPKSKKAKNRLANLMDGNDECIIEQHKNNEVFLASMNQKYFFWVNLSNDPDWQVDL